MIKLQKILVFVLLADSLFSGSDEASSHVGEASITGGLEPTVSKELRPSVLQSAETCILTTVLVRGLSRERDSVGIHR